eukprot:6186-Heterococcus_DN1.PRE.3
MKLAEYELINLLPGLVRESDKDSAQCCSSNQCSRRAEQTKRSEKVEAASSVISRKHMKPFLEGAHKMTDDDKQNAMAMGAVQILKGLLIAKFALRADEDSLRVANGLTLTSALLEEGFALKTEKDAKFRSLTKRSQRLCQLARGIVSAATLIALYTLRGADARVDGVIDTTTAPYLETDEL